MVEDNVAGWGRTLSFREPVGYLQPVVVCNCVRRLRPGYFWFGLACSVLRHTKWWAWGVLLLLDHNGLTWKTLASEDSRVFDVTSVWRMSFLVMMKTMEEELKVTLFLGRTLPPPHAADTTIGRMGRWTGARGRSLRLHCKHVTREQSSCIKQRRNCEQVKHTHRSPRTPTGTKVIKPGTTMILWCRYYSHF